MALLSYQFLAVTILLAINSLLVSAQASDVYTLCDPNWSGIVDIHSFSPSIFIESPNFGAGSYANNQLCTAVIRSGHEPLVLSFSYSSFTLENQPSNCAYDSLCVSGAVFCGSWPTQRTFHNILPADQTLTLRFKTDYSVILSGFQVEITAEYANSQVVQEVIDGVYSNEGSPVFNSVNYYDGYPYYDKCAQSTLSYPPVYFNTTTTTTPEPVIITEPETTPLINENIYSFCEDLWGPNVININAASYPFLIRSPYYGVRSYDNYQNCTLVIRSGPESLILTVQLRDLQLERCGACVCDYLCAFGVKFCGIDLNSTTFQYILPAYSDLTLRFATDHSVALAGFEIGLSQELAIAQTITEAVGGVGDYRQNVVYENVTFPLEEPYRDRCAQSYNWYTTPVTDEYTTPATDEYTTPVTDEYTTPATDEYTTPTTTRSPCLSNVSEIDAEIIQAIEVLNYVRAKLQQTNY